MSDEFPEPGRDAGLSGGEDAGPDRAPHDRLGTELAVQIANSLAGILPPPRGVRAVRRPRPIVDEEQRSGAHPDRRDPQLFGPALNALVVGRGWTTDITLRQLLTQWPRLVGETNAAHCSPESFADGVLVVRAESSTWASALRSMAPQVISTINRALGMVAVRRIDVRGPSAPSWKHGVRSVRDGRGPRDTYG